MAEQSKPKQTGGFQGFLARKDIVFSFQRYGIEALGAMALGLFGSLLIGTIVKTVGEQLVNAFGPNAFFNLLLEMGKFAMSATGAAMAIAIGNALKAKGLVLFSLTGVGMAANSLGGAGGPIAVLIIVIFAAEFGKMVYKETPVDIIVSPFVTIFVGVGLSVWWAPAIGKAAQAVGNLINWSTAQQPFVMGILVAVIVGVALTLPISSAAICAGLGLVGLAGGAAVAGCCAQMVGFAVMSYRENKVGGLVAQGLGTSMLQVPNIMKNPRIWIPPTLASVITGPLATVVFKMHMNGAPVAAGMGTSGLVGPIGVITGWLSPSEAAVKFEAMKAGFTTFDEGTKTFLNAAKETFDASGLVHRASAMDWIGLLLIAIVLPALLTWLIALPLRKMGWIKENDLKLEL